MEEYLLVLLVMTNNFRRLDFCTLRKRHSDIVQLVLHVGYFVLHCFLLPIGFSQLKEHVYGLFGFGGRSICLYYIIGHVLVFCHFILQYLGYRVFGVLSLLPLFYLRHMHRHTDRK